MRATSSMFAVILAVGGIGAASAQMASPGPRTSEAGQPARVAADAGLRTFGDLVTELNYRKMGFESVAEVRSAVLGEPFRDAFIRLDELRGFQAGADAEKLLQPGQRVLYPVAVGATVRSSIAVAQTKAGWKPVSFGAPNMVRTFSSARDAVARETKLSPSAFFIVRVPALKLQFLAYTNAGALTFVPILDDGRFNLKKGEKLAAAEALGRLVEAAKATKDDAPG